MTPQDLFNNAVKNALVNDGWNISDGLFELKFNGDNYDCGSELLLNAEKDAKKISILIEPFLSSSWLKDFHLALGRYCNCQLVLQQRDLGTTLFSAVTTHDYENYFHHGHIEEVSESVQMRLLVFDFQAESINLWIDYENEIARNMSPQLLNKDDYALLQRTVEEL